MMHRDHGTREAEFVIRTAPDRVDFWLRKARTDRQRWIIRLFRPTLRQFLDGFIAGLEAYSGQPRHEVPVPPLRIAPVVPPRGYSEAINRDVPPPEPVEPVVKRKTPPQVEVPPPPQAAASPAPAPVPTVIDALPAAPLPQPDEPESSSAPAPHTEFTRTVGYPEGDRAIGVFRMSGWSAGGASSRSSASASTSRPARAPVDSPVEPVPPPSAQQPPEIVWTNALEHARTVGVVDMSAYDTLDYLSELRDVFDRRESLRNGAAGPEDPRAR